jgi:hypothetical protein
VRRARALFTHPSEAQAGLPAGRIDTQIHTVYVHCTLAEDMPQHFLHVFLDYRPMKAPLRCLQLCTWAQIFLKGQQKNTYKRLVTTAVPARRDLYSGRQNKRDVMKAKLMYLGVTLEWALHTSTHVVSPLPVTLALPPGHIDTYIHARMYVLTMYICIWQTKFNPYLGAIIFSSLPASFRYPSGILPACG